jgi:hypothetical protein
LAVYLKGDLAIVGRGVTINPQMAVFYRPDARRLATRANSGKCLSAIDYFGEDVRLKEIIDIEPAPSSGIKFALSLQWSDMS